MSEVNTHNHAKQEPQTTYLKDYQVPPYLVDEVNLIIDLFDDYATVKSHLRVRHNRHSLDKTKSFKLNGEDLTLEEIRLNGERLAPSQYELIDHYLVLHQVPDNFELDIKTKIYPQKNTALSGLYRSQNTFCTQCEAEGFRHITYFPDHPDILARYSTTISADESRYPYLLSNGNIIGMGKLEGGRHWVKWEDPFNKPCYLFALVAGDFDLLEDKFVTQSGRDVQLKIYVEKGYVKQAHHAMYSLKEAMRWDEKAYGREYDLDVYMIVAIGDFNMGAMENKGLNIFNTHFVLAQPETATDDDYIHILAVIGHEYFHNWSGNRVTCRDWFQLSLKEGLTIFREQSFTEDRLSPAVMRIREVNYLRVSQFPEDAGPLAHPVCPDSYIEINNFYTATIYNKGSEVLRMMQTILGKPLFRKGMDLYFARHDGQAVTIEDYVKTMEDVSGIDLKQFRLWYKQSGTPVVSVKDEYDEKQKTYALTLTQSIPPTPGQPTKSAMHIPVRMGLLDKSGKEMKLYLNNEAPETEKVLALTQSSQTFLFKNVESRPIPSLFRNFSAPIKLQYDYSDEALNVLFEQDKDSFNRWEAGQIYALRILLKLISDHQSGKALQLPPGLVAMFQHILQNDKQDNLLLAEMLCLPTEKYIGEQMEVVDVDAIHHVREFAVCEIAKKLKNIFMSTYQQFHNPSKPYEFDLTEIAKRQLKNICFSYLLKLPENAELGWKQFEAALTSNMTDTLIALNSLNNLDSPLRQKALDLFYETWKHDALVVDKWFAIQAGSILPGTIQQIKKLVKHEAFDIKNPNKVYALIGTFGFRNPIHFHARNGEGYVFLREFVQDLDTLNPQVTGRMVNPLTTWKRYDKDRQQLMREQLNILLSGNKISKDLYEIVTKSI